MTIDTTGRAHKPAGSPASTGGQFATATTPGAAATLDRPAPSTAGWGLTRGIERAMWLRETADLCDETRKAHPEARHIVYRVRQELDGHYVSRASLRDEFGATLDGVNTEDLRDSLGSMGANDDDYPASTVADDGDYVIDLNEDHRANYLDAMTRIDLSPLVQEIRDAQENLR